MGMSDLERRISQRVEAERKAREFRPEVVCAAADFSRASYYVRLNDGGWRVTELEAIAGLFGETLPEFLISADVSAWTGTAAGRRHLRLVRAA